MKPRKLEAESWSEWACSPDSSQNTEFGQRLIDERDKVWVVAEWTCPDLSYEYDDYAVVRLGRRYAVLNTSGCSCPSPTETWGILFEGTKAEVRKYLEAEGDHPADFYHDREKSACKEMLEQMS